MRLVTATVAVAAFFALAGPVFAEAMSSSSYWDNMRRYSSVNDKAPYALTGDDRRASHEGLRVCTGWIGGGRERRTIYKLN